MWLGKLKRRKYFFMLLNATNMQSVISDHSPSDLEALQSVVKTKTKKEIELYICKMKKGAVRKIRANRGPKAPIEYWLNLLSDLTSQEKKDYTVNLGKVVSIIANFEEFPPPGPITPDYKAIYRYISGMLSESELPDLGKLESAVVLDLLHGLVDFLRSHNTTTQREIMQWKYNLLAGKVDMSDPLSALIKARKAIENDFSDFTSENPESSSESSSQCTSQQRNPNDSQPGSSTQTSSKKRTVLSDSPCPNKPTLFTMNPLCIPVSVIKMKPIINVTIGQLNNVVTPNLPSTQRLLAQQKGVVKYKVLDKKISPHPRHPIHRQQLLPVQTNKGHQNQQQKEVYVCEPHPDKVIVCREVPKGRGQKSKLEK
ncbi:uncharacterized protein LOC125682563 isoform X2 [Ostrea edulis]|uniref:uncharacterized protein LOC125682563 isoform X2 n=1 Tax=Ostrea edulis TaxID=37623 RepID=UPI0024AE8E9A|nr:uncharacterized protein LOC125682563 isoform X2 [Ostrea edulis]XP_056011577.1 uncharacterized protein LOC125682563 isoform X2 [Ostrea edulis]